MSAIHMCRLATVGCMIGSVTLMSCIDTHVKEANIPLYLKGTETTLPISTVGDVTVQINRADLAFGPLYLCAGVTAGDLCETARLEWLDTAVVDLINGESIEVGELSGVTGVVLSWMYDLGISAQLTNQTPFVLDAAKRLEGHSLALEGEANINGIDIPFSALIVAQQSDDTELGVPIIRKSISERFTHDVQVNDLSLEVRFDPKSWIEKLDLRPYVSFESCTEDAPNLLCDGTIERRCEGGMEISSKDCTEQNEVCLTGQGCQERLMIEEGSEAYRSLRNALMIGERPSFIWNEN